MMVIVIIQNHVKNFRNSFEPLKAENFFVFAGLEVLSNALLSSTELFFWSDIQITYTTDCLDYFCAILVVTKLFAEIAHMNIKASVFIG